MKSKDKMKLLKALPAPDDLKQYMSPMKKPAMFKALLDNDLELISDITLLAILMGTVRMLMDQLPNWEDFIDVDEYQNQSIEDQVPKHCDDPDCVACNEIEKAIKTAKAAGASVKVVELTEAQAIEMGLDTTKDHDAKFISLDNPNKVVH